MGYKFDARGEELALLPVVSVGIYENNVLAPFLVAWTFHVQWPDRNCLAFDVHGVMLSAFITVGMGMLAGLLVHRLTTSPAFGTFADVLFGVTGAFAARVLTDLVLQTDSLSLAAVPWVLGSAAALPAGIHMAMKRDK